MMAGCEATTDVAAGEAVAIRGTAIPDARLPVAAAARMARVMNEGLVRIESSMAYAEVRSLRRGLDGPDDTSVAFSSVRLGGFFLHTHCKEFVTA
jgi:hypothetical protein